MKKKKTTRLIAYGVALVCVISAGFGARGLLEKSFALPQRQEFVIGEAVTAVWQDQKLVISGTGPTYDYFPGEAPFLAFADVTEQIVIEDGVTRIGDYLCYGLGDATGELRIPRSVLSIGKGAFSGPFKEQAPHFTSIVNGFEQQTVTYETNDEELEIAESGETLEQNQARGNQGGKKVILLAKEDGDLEKSEPEEELPIGALEESMEKLAETAEPVETMEPPIEEPVIQPTEESKENMETMEQPETAESTENKAESKELVQETSETVESTSETVETKETSSNENRGETTVESEEQKELVESGSKNQETVDKKETSETMETDETKETKETKETAAKKKKTIEITYTEQIVGNQIFYPGQVGAYEVADPMNGSFLQAVQNAGYGAFLGTREISLVDWEAQERTVLLTYTDQGVILPELATIGLEPPLSDATVQYTFLGYRGASGNLYAPRNYAEEYRFILEVEQTYVELEEQTIDYQLSEDTTLVIHGQLPKGAELFVKSPLRIGDNIVPSSDGETVTREVKEALEQFEKEGNRVWQFSLGVFVQGKLLDLTALASGQNISCTLQTKAKLVEKKIAVYEIREQGLLPMKANESFRPIDQESQLMSIDFETDHWSSFAVVEQDLITIPEHVLLTVVARGVTLKLPEITASALAQNLPEESWIWDRNSSWVMEEEKEEATEKDSENGKENRIFYQEEIGYEEECTFSYLLDEDQEAPVFVSIYIDRILCEHYELIDETEWSIPKEFTTKDVVVLISASGDTLEEIPVTVSVDEIANYLPLEASQSATAAVEGVWDVKGCTVLFTLERPVEEKDLSSSARGAFREEDAKLVFLQGDLPAGTKIFLLAQREGNLEVYQQEYGGATGEIYLQNFQNYGQSFSMVGVSSLQFVFEWKNAAILPGNTTYVMSLQDNLVLTENQAMIQLREFSLDAAEIFVGSQGINGKEYELFEYGNVSLCLRKTASSAFVGKHLVFAFYADPACKENVVLPEQTEILHSSSQAYVNGNMVILENSASSMEQVTLGNLAGYQGIGQNVDLYVKAYLVEECQDGSIGSTEFVAKSDVAKVHIASYSDYGMAVDTDTLLIEAGDGMPRFSLSYSVGPQAGGRRYVINGFLQKSSLTNEEGYETLKSGILNQTYCFTTAEGMTKGNFQNMKAYLPADLTEGNYRLVLQMMDENGHEMIQQVIHILVEE